MTTLGLLKRRVIGQFLRFGLVGIASTVLNYLVFIILLIFLDINYLVSAGVGFVSGVFFGFLFNEAFTFSSKRKRVHSFPLYLLVYLLTLAINLVFLKVLVDNGWGKITANLILAPLIIAINFLGSKIIAFKDIEW